MIHAISVLLVHSLPYPVLQNALNVKPDPLRSLLAPLPAIGVLQGRTILLQAPKGPLRIRVRLVQLALTHLLALSVPVRLAQHRHSPLQAHQAVLHAQAVLRLQLKAPISRGVIYALKGSREMRLTAPPAQQGRLSAQEHHYSAAPARRVLSRLSSAVIMM